MRYHHLHMYKNQSAVRTNQIREIFNYILQHCVLFWNKRLKGKHFSGFAPSVILNPHKTNTFYQLKNKPISDHCCFSIPSENNVFKGFWKATLAWNMLKIKIEVFRWRVLFPWNLNFLALVFESFTKQTPQNLMKILLLQTNCSALFQKNIWFDFLNLNLTRKGIKRRSSSREVNNS